ncbi:sugar phosphate isomerase/epimerase family protein [Spirosoma validum]|uniref:Sugar phosphate isomerase/epimerase n=1 Tax=Spirosoma validum TaxID=2771355 RepID=A0A927GEA8_9BACT|nr:sugar phosphate isomerase/epimerase family protein [Spirosoma validum]MBD2754569.1 sugar phosphate isomerase/epimerase [Spirosoma validum]
MAQSLTRRQTLAALTASVGASLSLSTAKATPAAQPSFTICLNMSTIRGHKLGFVKEMEVASKAGFRSVEIWIETLQQYLKNGGTAVSARKILADTGIKVENAIGFAPWIIDDDSARAKGLEQLKGEMEMLAEIGCKRVATPPVGAQSPGSPKVDLHKAAERYRAILELGDKTGVVPQLELWGFSPNLSRLGEVMFVAIESAHPSARVLLDIYHLYKGGSGSVSLPLVGKSAIEVFHVNDYTADFTKEKITDADRVFPGDGVAPIRDTLKLIKRTDMPIVLSLEVFNKVYYAQEAQTVANTAMTKMKAMVAGI